MVEGSAPAAWGKTTDLPATVGANFRISSPAPEWLAISMLPPAASTAAAVESPTAVTGTSGILPDDQMRCTTLEDVITIESASPDSDRTSSRTLSGAAIISIQGRTTGSS